MFIFCETAIDEIGGDGTCAAGGGDWDDRGDGTCAVGAAGGGGGGGWNCATCCWSCPICRWSCVACW